MNIAQIRAAAEKQFSYLGDPSCIKICVGSAADDSIANRIADLLRSAVNRAGLSARIVRTGSSGLYDLEPLVAVEQAGQGIILYNNITPDTVDDFIDDLAKGASAKPKALCCIGNDKKANGIPHISEFPLFALQNRIALRNCGWIDPEDINHYITQGQGYTGLSKALLMDPVEIIGDAIPAALKNRGGLGYSTADKWELFCALRSVDKYLICCAVDANPRSLISRLLLESDPHSVLEGMLIGAYACGASRCFIMVEEKSAAGRRIEKVLDQMREYNLLGSNILDSEFSAEIGTGEMPELLTVGNRIELFRCIEESQPIPHAQPAYPAVSEFIGKPVLMCSPETMSSLSAILCGDMKAGGESKVVTLSGSVVHKYTVEVSPEMTIGGIIENFGGGVLSGQEIKAVQFGGPTGPFVSPDELNLSCIDSDTIEVFDVQASIVGAAKNSMAYLQAQSCGKCVFCREGCLQMLTILEDISENKGQPQDLELLIELGEEMRTACLCDFGRAAPNPIQSSIRLFRGEYEKRFPD
jgi:NADH-quinone oxidoreductase subunit F